MQNHAWTAFGGCLVFYDNTEIADGQHRLSALIKASATFDFVVVRGLPRAAGLNVDTGLSRTIVDAARISGLDPMLTTQLVATSRAIAEGNVPRSISTNASRLLYVKEHRAAAQWAIANGPRGRMIRNAITLGAIGRAYYYEPDLIRLADFGQLMTTGMASSQDDHAAISIRNYLINQGSHAAAWDMWRDTFLKVQNAIRYYMRGQKLGVIRSVASEAYPLDGAPLLGRGAMELAA